MKIFNLTATVIAVAVVSLTIDEVGARGHPLNENAALALLERTLKHDGVYTHRISLDCVTYSTEETKASYFQFVLRENHTAKCGGDPETSPVVDRYRVYRASGKIEWLEQVEDAWQPYNPAKIR
jgi:hypothetical protein